MGAKIDKKVEKKRVQKTNQENTYEKASKREATKLQKQGFRVREVVKITKQALLENGPKKEVKSLPKQVQKR